MKTAEQRTGGFSPGEFEQLIAVEEGNFWFEPRNELIAWALGRYAPEARNYLEVGCGTGFVLAGIHEAFPGLRLTGTELHSEGLDYARRRVPSAELAQMDARDMPYAAEFDAIGIFDVLEHIEEDEQVLDQIRTALKPGGVVLVTVPQHRWLWSGNDVTAMHVRRYVRRELRTKLERSGFELMRLTSFVSLLLPLMYAARLRRREPVAEGNPEFEIGARANAVLLRVMRAEGALIRRGVSLPAGGSLLAVARSLS